MTPTPPSQATMADCQPLSCHATAFIRSTGTVIAGRATVSAGSGTTPSQYLRFAAATRAALTSPIAASGPDLVGWQEGSSVFKTGVGGCCLSGG
jgi:hypothetical protein